MFDPTISRQRRNVLVEKIRSGLLLLPGLGPSPVNFAANPYPFRQDSSFLYYTGVAVPDYILTIDLDTARETLYGPDRDPHETIWSGPSPSMNNPCAMHPVVRMAWCRFGPRTLRPYR